MIATAVRITLTDGETFEVEPGETVLSAAHRQGVNIPYSCQSGTCRSCLSRILSGRVEHDPEYADDLLIRDDEVEDGYRLLCSSFAYSDSVIEFGG